MAAVVCNDGPRVQLVMPQFHSPLATDAFFQMKLETCRVDTDVRSVAPAIVMRRLLRNMAMYLQLGVR